MNLLQAGIAIRCQCGAYMSVDMMAVLFYDRGVVKINNCSIRCQVCDAMYWHGERLKYRLVKVEENYEPRPL